jgi:hypothetical protein
VELERRPQGGASIVDAIVWVVIVAMVIPGTTGTLLGITFLARTYRERRGVSDYPARLVSAVSLPSVARR